MGRRPMDLSLSCEPLGAFLYLYVGDAYTAVALAGVGVYDFHRYRKGGIVGLKAIVEGRFYPVVLFYRGERGRR